jgi:hypothetical protein
MIFTDDTEEALRSAVWLVNSAEDPETLADLDDYARFLAEFPYTGRLDRDEAELASLRALRPRLHATRWSRG